MTTKMKTNTVRRLTVWAAVVAAVLMIPFVTKAPWTGSDYVFAGIVLYGCAAAYELATKNMSNRMHRVAVGVAVAMVVLLIWAWAVA